VTRARRVIRQDARVAGPNERRFTSRVAQVALTCFGCLFLFFALGGFVSGSWGVALAFLLAGTAFTFRALVSATVVVKLSTLDLQGFARTRHLRLDSLAFATVEIGTTGMNGHGREYLVLHRTDGSIVRFKELNAKPSRDRATVVQHAADAVNHAIPRHT
jgi:hypothetical protein